MKRIFAAFTAVAFVAALTFAGDKHTDEFPLTLHITAIDVQQGIRAVHGHGSTSGDGNYSSHVSGGGSYFWGLYTARIDGDNRILGMAHRRGPALSIGDYKARWSKPRELKVQYTDNKGRQKEETFVVLSEHISEAPTAK